jgi:hypothetical protein
MEKDQVYVIQPPNCNGLSARIAAAVERIPQHVGAGALEAKFTRFQTKGGNVEIKCSVDAVCRNSVPNK